MAGPAALVSKDDYLANTKIPQDQGKGQGRKFIDCCSVYIGSRVSDCPICGAAIPKAEKATSSSKSSNSSNTSEKPKLPRIEVIRDFLTILKLLEEVKQQEVTIEEFVDSIKLDWDVLDNVTSIKELKDLKSRRIFGSLIDKYGASEVISCCKKIVEEQ